jgi:hypothetical protein
MPDLVNQTPYFCIKAVSLASFDKVQPRNHYCIINRDHQSTIIP